LKNMYANMCVVFLCFLKVSTAVATYINFYESGRLSGGGPGTAVSHCFP
jgi:hypothetical protein